MKFKEIEFPIKVIYESKKIHKIGHAYEFRNNKNKDVYGIVIKCVCVFEEGLDDRIIYTVKNEDGEEILVDHDINREL